jgi:cystathionine beta-lyase
MVHKTDTRLAHAGRHPRANHGVVNPPVVRASTVLYPSIAAMAENLAAYEAGEKRTVYGRRGGPTIHAFEEAFAAIDCAEACFAVPSGIAAFVYTLTALVGPGDHVLISDAAYMPVRRFAEMWLRRAGVAITYYDPIMAADIARLMRPETRLVYVESPASHTFDMQDIPAIAAVAHSAGAKVLMDNSWATPLFYRPFDHGVDVAVYSASKYVGGHADLCMGVISARAILAQTLRQCITDHGANVGPDDCWLALRGLRTLSVRLHHHQATALRLAHWLEGRPEVARVLHPGLPSHPGHDLWRRDWRGASGLFSVVLKPAPEPAVVAMVDGMQVFALGGSWGSYESQILPVHPERDRSVTLWDSDGPTLRLAAGLEDPDDLEADLAAGLARLSSTGAPS